ncbi:GTPase IMAP family member 4-like [Physella acuta]|uniref:GTPase IMAP family member 4-like n=1 Tax=Physella acuta TaxID=109671 RepID=UPI0027DAD00B|nr:GTPase IMAP family member 4-like [Physella acuta]
MGNSQTSRRKFLLMGKTGAGKSSTANTLLQKEVFKQSTNATACTKTVELHGLQYKEMYFDVVDTPGLMDTELDEIDNTKFTRGNMIEAMKICEGGFNALLLIGDLNLMKDSAKVLKDDTEKVISAFGILTHNNNLNLTNLPVNGNSTDSEINPTANFLQLTEKVTSTFKKYLEKEPKCSKQSEQYMEMNQILNSPLQNSLRILGIHMEKLKSPANVIEDMNFQIHYWISVIAEEAHGTRLLDDVMTEAEDLKKEIEQFQVNRALHFFA